MRVHSDVSGVLLFTDDFYHGRYIENPNALENIKLTFQELENEGIILAPHWPLITYDKKEDLSNLEQKAKENRIMDILSIERAFDLSKDTLYTPYTRQDTIELLDNIREYLQGKDVNMKIVNATIPAILKYCNFYLDYPAETYNQNENKDETLIMIHDEPIRAHAASSLVLLTYHLPDEYHIELVKKLSLDNNSYVRGFLCKELSYLYEKNSKLAIDLAYRYYKDNKLVRFFLQPFLIHIFKRDKLLALDLFEKIVQQYGMNSSGTSYRNNLIVIIVSILVQAAILLNLNQYSNLLMKIISDSDYNEIIKKEIIFEMREERYLTNSNDVDKVLGYYEVLLKKSSLETIGNVDFFLLYRLIQNKKSLYPKIKPVLDIITTTIFPTIYGYGHIYHFQILSYLEEFCSDFPLDAMRYLNVFLNNNSFFLESFNAYQITDLIKKIFDTSRDYIEKDTEVKNIFIAILQRIKKDPRYNIEYILEFYKISSH